MEKDGLVDNAEVMGRLLLDGLRSAVGRSRIVGEVRGRGLMVCVEFIAPEGSGTPLDRARVATLDRLACLPRLGLRIVAKGGESRRVPPVGDGRQGREGREGHGERHDHGDVNRGPPGQDTNMSLGKPS